MRCPKCYSGVDKLTRICKRCGFKIDDLKQATNTKAKKNFRSGDGDLVLYTTTLPQDLSKKSLLLYCGLLGFLGAHYFYMGKIVRGLINLVFSLYGIIFSLFYALNFTGGEVFKYFQYFAGIFFALIIILTVIDFVKICFNKFKVPVAF